MMMTAKYWQLCAAESSSMARLSFELARDPRLVIWYQEYSALQYAEARKRLEIETS